MTDPDPCPAGGAHRWTDEVDDRFADPASSWFLPPAERWHCLGCGINRAAVVDLTADGLTQREVAEVLGVAKGTVGDDVAQNRANGNGDQDQPADDAQNRAEAAPPPSAEELEHRRAEEE